VFGLLEQKGRSAGVQFRARHKDSSWRWIEGSITNLLGEESVEALVLNYRDITERKHAEQKIQHQAYHDPLTSLPNRLLFQDRLGLGIAHAQRSGKKLAVMYADLDRFKWINDTLGHAAGDRLLVAVAERLRGCLRDDDTVARVGGDEFTLLLPDLNRADDAAKLASKLVEAVARPFDIDGGQIHVTVSIGVSVHPDDGTDAESLLKGADNALYRAKEAGRNNAQLCTPALNARARHRMELERALRQALERAELLLHYQPQFEARTRRLVGAEALLRWNHPQAGLLYPDDFIPVAEDSRLIVPIGEWALRAACRQARQWHDRRSDLAIAVNLSGRQFERAGLRAVVDSALEDSGLDPARLELEITESVALREASAASTLLERLRARGVRVAIDDFGTGHSSLQSLQRLPIDALKIDRAFVKNLGLGQNGQAIVRAIIAMAHSMRLRVVAEGVETESQLRFLERERCEELQGYLLGRPLPAEQFERLLDAAPAPRAN
jgi:diguanylate cyclase (GGDEF)-like protein